MDLEELQMTVTIFVRDQVLNRIVPGVIRTTPWSWTYWTRDCERRWEAESLTKLFYRRWRWRQGMSGGR